MDRNNQIAAFIAQKGVTRCPPADGNATPLALLRARKERKLTNEPFEFQGDPEVSEVESEAQKRFLEIQGIRD